MGGQGAPTLTVYQVAQIAVLALVGLNLIVNLRMLRHAAPRGKGVLAPGLVSVLVPARNEARNIRRCVQSLLVQDYPLLEVLVLDDSSTDATANIVAEMAQEDPRLRLVRGRTLPQGWMGKNYACHQLSQLARGEWFLFVDADTRHRPNALTWAIEAMQQNQADLLSLVPHTVTHTLGEELLLPIIPFGLIGCFPLALSMYVRLPWLTAALGTFMLFRRETYERISGHQGVSSEIAEDMALARRVRRAGGRVVLVNGSEQVDVHFYHGFRESWRGLTKSVFAALEYRLVPTLLMIGLHGFLFLWPVILCLSGLLTGQMGDPAQQLALLTILVNGGLWYTLAVRFHLPRRTALLYPATIALTILIIFDSIRRAAFSGIGWKERVYHVRGESLRH